jgi:membrane protease YdiL (CAAX protease family)
VKKWGFLLLQHNSDEVPWTIEQTLAGALFTLLPWLAFAFLITSFGSKTPQPKVFSLQQDIVNAVVGLAVALISEGIFLVAPAYFVKRTVNHSLYLRRARRQTMLDMLGFRRFNVLRSLALVILFFVGLIAVNILYTLLITTFHLHIQTNDQVVLERGRVLPISTYTTLAVAVLIAPICEEVFFRSFIFMGLRRGMPLTLSVVLSALFFAVAHGDPASFPVLFIIGLALAIIRWRAYSIWPGIILHTLNNATSALLIILSLRGIGF